LQWLQDYVSPFGVEILPEVHENYSYHQKISANGYWTYDFSLPMLVLNTLYHHTSRVLKQWLAICPANR
jgi:sucrose phosphorylase